MSEDDCCLPEVLETEQVVEIMDESQLLDLAASMETRGELVAGTSCKHFEATDTENRLLAAGMKRKRDESELLEEGGLLSLPLPTAIVPPSPRQVIASPLPSSQPPLPTPSHPYQTSPSQDDKPPQQLQNDATITSSVLPAINIQLTSDELQALFSILRQRDSTPDTANSSTTPSTSSSQLLAPKKLVTAVVMPSSSSSSLPASLSLPTNLAIVEAQTVAAAKASVQGKKRHCSCKNSQCLKLYCDCFSHEESCSVDCSCRNCRNNPAYSEMRDLTVKMYKGRDPSAFRRHSESGLAAGGQRSRGCKCRKTLCLKKYCECYHSGVHCSALCRCIDYIYLAVLQYITNHLGYHTFHQNMLHPPPLVATSSSTLEIPSSTLSITHMESTVSSHSEL